VAGRVELDIVMLGEELLPDEIFFPIERDCPMRATISVFKLLWNLTR
jgi:hypothetical protein